jgi:glycosyltransferase involved in cell wall biosynthesis
MKNKNISILHNIISPYKTVLFNELYKIEPSLEVIYISPTEHRRKWPIEYNEISFPYKLLFQRAFDDIPFLALIKEIWKSLNQSNPDVLIITEYISIIYWIAMIWGKINNKKLIFWCDSTFEDKKRNFFTELIKKYFVKQFHAGLAPGIKSKEYLTYLGLPKENIFFSGYSVNNKFFSEEYKKHINNRNELLKSFSLPEHNFLFIGRLAPEKNLFNFIKAYKEIIKHDNKKWGLILIGDGPLKKEIENFINENDLSETIILPGFVEQNNIGKYFACSDALVLPSTSEPWGLVVNEAMACGLPVVLSTKCGCHPELLKDNGYLFDPSDNKQLIQALEKVINNDFLLNKMGKKSLEIINDFTPEKCAELIQKAIIKIQ